MRMQLTKMLDCLEKLTKWPWSNFEKQLTNIMDVALWPWKCCVYQCCWNSKDTVLHKHHIVIPVAVRGLLSTWWKGLVFQSWMVKVMYREIHEPTLMSAVRWSKGFWWRLGGVLHLSAEASGIQRENTNKLSGCAFFIMFFCKRDGYVKVFDENSPVVRVLQRDMDCGHFCQVYWTYGLPLQPLHEDLYSFAPERFFVGSFLDAIKDGSEAALRHILIAHSPGVFTFNMLKPAFCSMMLEEVQAWPELFWLELLN
jgi:hypothetical protein